jgi:hypothetical protein
MAAAGAVLCPARGEAHVLHADVRVAAQVQVVAYFDEDFPAEAATVVMIDAARTVVLSGRTDERGVWTFPRPAPGAYRLTITSSGHTVEIPIEVASDPDAPVVEITGPRPDQTAGLVLGLAGLLGISALFWIARRIRRANPPTPMNPDTAPDPVAASHPG